MKELKILSLIFLTLFAYSCEEFMNDSLKCNTNDYFTNEPLSNVMISFDVANGAGLFGSLDRDKYQIISDNNGRFELADLGDDIDNTFYPNFLRSYDFDSTQVEWRYLDNGSHDDSLWIVKDKNTRLRLKPAALTYFHHPIKNKSDYTMDTIFIKVYNQTDILTKDKQKSKTFYLLPSMNHDIEITYITNGQSQIKTIEKYISSAYSTKTGVAYEIIRHEFNIDIPE